MTKKNLNKLIYLLCWLDFLQLKKRKYDAKMIKFTDHIQVIKVS